MFHHPGRRNATWRRAHSTKGCSRKARRSARRVCVRSAARLPIRNFIGSASTALLGTNLYGAGDSAVNRRRYRKAKAMTGNILVCPDAAARNVIELRPKEKTAPGEDIPGPLSNWVLARHETLARRFRQDR